MTQTEFNSWWENFQARFPGKGEWIRKQENSDQVLATWFELLADIDIRDALAANRDLQSGEEPMPDSWELIPAMIRDIAERREANRIAAQYHGDEEPPADNKRCPDCDGTGLVIVPDRRCKDGGQGVAYACHCQRGDNFAVWMPGAGSHKKPQPYPRYPRAGDFAESTGIPFDN